MQDSEGKACFVASVGAGVVAGTVATSRFTKWWTKKSSPPLAEKYTPSKLPKNPNDLLADGWIETTHPKAGAAGHRHVGV